MKVLVLSGGQHPYQETTPILESFLQAAGHEVSVTEDASALTSKAMPDYNVLVFNTRREKELSLTRDQQAGLTQFIGGGNGFVCIHIAGCRPDGWPEYHDVTGGGWITGTSTHPPYGQFTVNVKDAAHPVAEGITDFVTNDELYIKLAWLEGNHVFLTAELDGETHPVAWSRAYGKGRVFKTTLGHDGLSFQTPQFQRLVLNGVAWAGSGKA
jgi:type 1 glutamine amidotransferase